MPTAAGSNVVSLIGAPTDIGASVRGASMGPEALRVAQIKPALERHGAVRLAARHGSALTLCQYLPRA